MQIAVVVDGPRVDPSADTGTEPPLPAGRHQTIYVQAPYRRHGHNNSLGAAPVFATLSELAIRQQQESSSDLTTEDDENQPVALTHSFVYEGPQRARTISYPGPGHRPSRSLGAAPAPPLPLPLPQPLPLTQTQTQAHGHGQLHTQARSLAYRQFNQDKPLPLLPPSSPAAVPTHSSSNPEPEPRRKPIEDEDDKNMMMRERGDETSDLLPDKTPRVLSEIKGGRSIASADIRVVKEKVDRADVSTGSWLDAYEQPEEERDSFLSIKSSFDLDDYLSRSAPSSPSPQPSTTTERPPRHPRAPTPPRSTSFAAAAIDNIRDQLEFFGNRLPTRSLRSANPSMTSTTPPSSQADHGSLAKGSLSRPGSEGEALYDVSHFARQPKVDPSNFPDPYPHGISYHQGTPALSSAGSSSASTRSSAYTNAGSTISASGYSGDYSHVRVASGDDFEGAGGIGGLGTAGLGINMAGATYATTDGVMEKLSRTSTGSSISRKSHGHAPSHAPHVPLPRMRHARTLHSQSQSQSHPEDFNITSMPTERPLRTQPSYDTSWQREHEDFGTSEDEFDFGQAEDDEEAGEEIAEEEEEEPGSAISVVEEGRGLIVHGEGVPIHTLNIQPGITHLLVGGSSTPNSVPAFLTTMLPQISSTLLALDISANFLVSLSPALASCGSLEELNISANPLRVLPEFLSHLTSLRLLLADSTGISTMPATLTALQKLHTLSIRRNKMHALPSWLCTLPCLESLLVDGNPFQGPWRALVEPLLARTPMTPSYPPSTPMISPPSATPISATNTTSVETTDISDTDDYTDQDETNQSAPSAVTTSSLAVPAPGDDNFEEDTITLAHARPLERSATSPPAHGASSPPPARPLSRTRTAPNRSYYERVKQSRTEEEIAGLSSPALASGVSRVNELVSDDRNATAPNSPNLMFSRPNDLRRMRSADELRRALSPTGGAPAGASLLSPPSSPPRPGLKHYATTSSASVISAGSEGASLQRRFASLNVHARSSSRASTRALSSNLFNVPTHEEDGDADVESPPASISRARAATTVSIARAPHDEEYEHRVRQSLAKPRKEKEKSGRKWGFLKKMSMGKLRPMEGATGSTSVPSSTRPSTSSGASGSSLGKPTITSVSMTPRQLTPPQVEVALPPIRIK